MLIYVKDNIKVTNNETLNHEIIKDFLILNKMDLNAQGKYTVIVKEVIFIEFLTGIMSKVSFYYLNINLKNNFFSNKR